jgi:hypothetical protein
MRPPGRGLPRGGLTDGFEARPARVTKLAHSSARELLHRPYAGEHVRGYLGHVLVGDLQNPEAATSRHERFPNCPLLALGEESGRVDRLTCGQLE